MRQEIIVQNLTVGYRPGVPVLRDITVTVQPGQVLAVTGSSGAGKTTLLRTMAGLLKPANGSVLIGGSPVRNRDHAVQLRVALIPQHSGLATMLTAAENLQVVLVANGVSAPEARKLTAEALDRVGLSGQADQLAEEMSGGQQQRAAIARGLALQGDVLLADEVTSELDSVNRQRVIELLMEQADRGAAVVFATHDPEAAAVCHAELHLDDGQGEVRVPAGSRRSAQS